MRVKVVATTMRSYPYIDPGKKDRRYKTGYRIAPTAKSNIELMFEVDNEDGFLRSGQTLKVEQYGTYYTTATDKHAKTATLRVASMADMIKQSTIAIPNHLNILPLGFMVQEGGSCG